MKTILSSFAFAAAVVLASLPAQSATIIHNFALSATPGNTGTITSPDGSSFRQRFWFANVAPFTLNDGDVVDSTVTFDGPVGMSDTLGNQDEAFVIVYTPAIGLNPAPYTSERNHQVTSIGGATGAYTGVLPSFSSTFTANNVPLAQVAGGNLTDSFMEFTSFNLVTTYVQVPPLAQPITQAFILLRDEVTPAPAPGALALLGIGVFGLAAARKRFK